MDLEYHREYNIERYHRVRQELIVSLGGHCVGCGSLDNLEIDHINPAQKSFDISIAWAYARETVDAELQKCQILCHDCHKIKSIYDRGMMPAKGTHGTVSSYRYCRCELCKEAKNIYMREYRSSRRSTTG